MFWAKAYQILTAQEVRLHNPLNTIILEEASLELVPKKYRNHENCRDIEQKFGVAPESQILDDNYHHPILLKLPDGKKRGRPDIVHLALLDITSTPLYMNGDVSVVIHTLHDKTIELGERVRLPRTLNRFCGVMSRVLSDRTDGSLGSLIKFKEDESLKELLLRIGTSEVLSFSRIGVFEDLSQLVRTRVLRNEKSAWMVGGFAHGHFREEVRALSDRLISISETSLPSHVVTARLSYELEKSLNVA